MLPDQLSQTWNTLEDNFTQTMIRVIYFYLIGRKITSIDRLCQFIITVKPGNIYKIIDYLSNVDKDIISIVIPRSVTSIGDYAFVHCRGLTSVVIPDSVTSIGKYSFAYCRSLTSIVIPPSVINIGICSFLGCPWFNKK